jgi:hypothetical protein
VLDDVAGAPVAVEGLALGALHGQGGNGVRGARKAEAERCEAEERRILER